MTEKLIAEGFPDSLIEAQEEIRELKFELNSAESRIEELEKELEFNGTDYKVQTNLGAVYFQNETGNLRLQEEIEAFANALTKKY